MKDDACYPPVVYAEIMELWKKGPMQPIADYLNKRGIYSHMNPKAKRLAGEYRWVNSDGLYSDLLVLGVMLFPKGLRHSADENGVDW